MTDIFTNGNVPIYSLCVRYNELKNIINQEYRDYSNVDSIVVFIDMNSALKSYFKGTQYSFDNYYDIVSGFINICAHYRQFFKSRFGTYCYLHLVYSDITSKKIGSMFYEKYSSKLNLSDARMVKMVEDNIKLLEILVPYLPWIQFTKTTQFETGVMIYDIIQKEYNAGSRYPNLVVTKDRYNFQLCSNEMDVRILRPVKNKSEDNSYAVNSNSVITSILWQYTNDTSLVNTTLSGDLLSALYALSRLPDKNISSYVAIKKAYEILSSAVVDGAIPNTQIVDMQYIADTILRKYYPKIDGYIVGERYKAINLYHNHSIMSSTSEKNTYQGFINLIDDNTVKEINNKFFVNNPLDLNAL